MFPANLWEECTQKINALFEETKLTYNITGTAFTYNLSDYSSFFHENKIQ